MPSSWAARTTRRSASTPRRWPSARGRPRAAAQRPLPSMMIATCNGPSVRSGPSVAGAAAFDIDQFPQSMIRKSGNRFSRTNGFVCSEIMLKQKDSLDGEDFLFLDRQQLIDLRDRPVSCLLHIIGQTLLIVLGNLVILLKLLDRIDAIAADMPNRDL